MKSASPGDQKRKMVLWIKLWWVTRCLQLRLLSSRDRLVDCLALKSSYGLAFHGSHWMATLWQWWCHTASSCSSRWYCYYLPSTYHYFSAKIGTRNFWADYFLTVA
jgi:hypothetical protein